MTNANTVIAFGNGNGSCHNSIGSIFSEGNILYSYGHHFTLAIQQPNETLINGDKYSPTTGQHTSLCIRHLKPNYQIPFSALSGAKLDPKSIKLIDKSADTYETVNYIDPKTKEPATRQVHHLGYSLIESDNENYLSGFDANDGFRAYFLCRLPCKVDSVDDALQALKPQEVIDSESQGLEVKRHGEWFMIPTDKVTRELTSVNDDKLVAFGGETKSHSGHIRTDTDGTQYARGCITHKPQNKNPTHKRLNLGKTWHKIVKNTATGSWESAGGID